MDIEEYRRIYTNVVAPTFIGPKEEPAQIRVPLLSDSFKN